MPQACAGGRKGTGLKAGRQRRLGDASLTLAAPKFPRLLSSCSKTRQLHKLPTRTPQSMRARQRSTPAIPRGTDEEALYTQLNQRACLFAGVAGELEEAVAREDNWVVRKRRLRNHKVLLRLLGGSCVCRKPRRYKLHGLRAWTCALLYPSPALCLLKRARKTQHAYVHRDFCFVTAPTGDREPSSLLLLTV